VDEIIFLNRIEEINLELISEGVPVDKRALAAFEKFDPRYEGIIIGNGLQYLKDTQGEYEAINLLEKIQNWYKSRYGEKFYSHLDVGAMPIIIQGEIYFLRIPFVYGRNCHINVAQLIDGITESMLNSMKKDDWEKALNIFQLGFNFFYGIGEIMDGLHHPEPTGLAKDLLERALHNIESALAVMKVAPVDKLQNCCFEAQQATEKFMKFYLVYKVGGFTEEDLIKKFNHKMSTRIFGEIKKTLPEIEQLEEDILNVDYKMEVRYKTLNGIDYIRIVESFYSAVKISLFLIQKAFDLKSHTK